MGSTRATSSSSSSSGGGGPVVHNHHHHDEQGVYNSMDDQHQQPGSSSDRHGPPHAGETHHRHPPPHAAAGGGMEEVPVSGGGDPRQQQRSFTRQVSRIDAPVVKTGILGTSSNLVNSIVGAGIIGIPYAIREAGIVIGILLLILVGMATDKSLRLIVELASFHPTFKDLGVHTFEDLMRIPFGNLGGKFILLSMFVLAYGAMVAYMLIIKDTVRVVQ